MRICPEYMLLYKCVCASGIRTSIIKTDVIRANASKTKVSEPKFFLIWPRHGSLPSKWKVSNFSKASKASKLLFFCGSTFDVTSSASASASGSASALDSCQKIRWSQKWKCVRAGGGLCHCIDFRLEFLTGARRMTFSGITLSIMAFSRNTLIRMPSIRTILSRMTLSRMPSTIMTLRRMTFIGIIISAMKCCGQVCKLCQHNCKLKDFMWLMPFSRMPLCCLSWRHLTLLQIFPMLARYYNSNNWC